MTSSIRTTRCRLSRLEVEDLPGVLRLRTDPEVRRYLGGAAREEDVRARFSAMLADAGAMHWSIFVREEFFVGLVTLEGYGGVSDAEISYEFLPEYWGRGLAVESVGAILQIARDTLQLPRVVAETQARNMRSRRLLERLGMRPVSRLRRHGAEQIVYATAYNRDLVETRVSSAREAEAARRRAPRFRPDSRRAPAEEPGTGSGRRALDLLLWCRHRVESPA